MPRTRRTSLSLRWIRNPLRQLHHRGMLSWQDACVRQSPLLCQPQRSSSVRQTPVSRIVPLRQWRPPRQRHARVASYGGHAVTVHHRSRRQSHGLSLSSTSSLLSRPAIDPRHRHRFRGREPLRPWRPQTQVVVVWQPLQQSYLQCREYLQATASNRPMPHGCSDHRASNAHHGFHDDDDDVAFPAAKTEEETVPPAPAVVVVAPPLFDAKRTYDDDLDDDKALVTLLHPFLLLGWWSSLPPTTATTTTTVAGLRAP